MGAHPYGQPAGGAAGIAVTTSYRSWVQFSTPKVFIDGYEMPIAGWGRTATPVSPGRHNVHVHVVDSLWRQEFGRADIVIDVQPGQLVELEYRMPMFGGAGSLGFGSQRSNGLGVFYGMMGALFVVVVVVILLVIVVVAAG